MYNNYNNNNNNNNKKVETQSIDTENSGKHVIS